MNNEQLVADYAATRSPVSLDQIVRDNQRLLHHVLKRFATADEPYEDLLQVANLGLIKAVQRFDPGKGVRFSTYAVPVVEGEVRHHLRDSLLLRQPRWVKKIYHEIEEAVGALSKKLGRPPHLSEIAAALNISEAGILEVAQRLRAHRPAGAARKLRRRRRRPPGRLRRGPLAAPYVVLAADRGPHRPLRCARPAHRLSAQADLPALLSRVHPARGGGRSRPYAEEGVARVDQGPGAAQAGHDAPRLLGTAAIAASVRRAVAPIARRELGAPAPSRPQRDRPEESLQRRGPSADKANASAARRKKSV